MRVRAVVRWWRWQERCAREGVDGLLRGKTRKLDGPETVVRVVALTGGTPPGEATHWTGRPVAKASGLLLGTIQRIWRAHQLQPHRVRSFKRLRDPQSPRSWLMWSASTWIRRRTP